MGTISRHVKKQPQLRVLLDELAAFRLCGEFMLTEVGHGLDARNIETTATLSSDGFSFDLHSPCKQAAKSMPPTTPLGGVPKVAVVFAQLVIKGEKQGVRAFVVHLTNGTSMCEGITTSLLPQRPGSQPIDHALTTFTHVRLDRDCLLGVNQDEENARQSFFDQIHRVSVGGLALSLCNVPALKACAWLTARFSQQRMVISPTTRSPVPIISFPTQYGPIISTMAQGAVMETCGIFAIGAFLVRGLPEPLKHALVCVFKATVTYATQRHLTELTDRCGWRGLFAFNKISEIQLTLKGNSIAEGDVLVLCISKL
jgi:acyl-CoA oxidase